MDLIIGSHVSFSKNEQLLGSVKEAISYKANTFMFYTGAPQNTYRVPIEDALTLEAYKLMKEHHISFENVVVHAPYIINLGNNEKLDSYRFAIQFLMEEVKRCETLHMTKLVLHPGSFVKLTREVGIHNIIAGLNAVLREDQTVTILLETMAGKGSEIGITMDEIKKILDGITLKDKVGVCLDTCHLNDSGVDIQKFDDYLEEFDQKIGISKIGCVHINDSKNEIGTHKDRHENIGIGTIGFDALLHVIYHEKLKGIPKILETPYVTNDKGEKVYPPYLFEIEMIRKKENNKNLLEDIRNYYK